MGSTNQDMSCSFGSRIWEKLKREVGCAIDDVLSLSCDFKYDVLKVEPYVSESGVTDCEIFDEKVPEDDPFHSVYASDALPSAIGDPTPFMVTWSTEEDLSIPGMEPAAGPGDPPETEIAEEEVTVLSFWTEPARTTSVPIGCESPYIKALMADTSSAASKSDGYVFDFDHIWDEDEDGTPEISAEPEHAEYNFVIFDLSEPVETHGPNFVILDLPETADEVIPMPDSIVSDFQEPVEAQGPNFVILDLPETTEEKIQVPNFILISSEECPKVISDETRDLMEMTIPGLVSDAKEMEDACSEETFLDDDANLAPMLIEECQIICAEEHDPVPAVPGEQSPGEGVQISFGFLSDAFGSPGGPGIDFLFGRDEEDSVCPENTYEAQTEQAAVQASPVQTQRMYL